MRLMAMAGMNGTYSYKSTLRGEETPIWERVVMGLAGSLLLLVGIVATILHWRNPFGDLVFYYSLLGVFVVLIIAGIGFGIAAAVPPKRGDLRSLLVAVAIPVILLSVPALVLGVNVALYGPIYD